MTNKIYLRTQKNEGINRRKFLTDLVITGGTLIGFGAFFKSFDFVEKITNENKTFTETYQGWTRDNERINYVFDPHDWVYREQHEIEPKYKLIGDINLRDSLKIGEEYIVTFESSVLPWTRKLITSIKKTEGEK